MLRYAETPKALLADIARQIARIRNPRARHWIITPARGRSEHVVATWAHLTGIASHSQELDLRTLLEQVCAGNRPRFDFDALRIAIASTLPALRAHPLLPIPADIPLDSLNATLLSWATLLGRAIDETLQCRDFSTAWQAHPFLKALTAEPAVHAALRAHPGLLSDSDFSTAAAQWLAAWRTRGEPPYLWIQLDAGLPSLLFKRLLQTIQFLHQTEFSDRLHLFAITPSFEFWSDQITRSRNRRAGLAPRDPSRDPGGLLWALGRCSQDFQSQVSDSLLSEGTGGTELPSEPCAHSLLGQLQESCRRSAPPAQLPVLDEHDSSLTVHSAHTRLRELEICRDRILQAREELDDLRDEEVLLLLSNPAEQAPCVEAAFHGAPRARIPFRMAGFGQAIPSAFATALELLLDTLPGRIPLPDIQALLEHPLIARRLGFNTESGEARTVVTWLRDAGFRWGVDSQHRATEQNLAEHRWNLSWALQRLALGGIVPEAQRDTPRGEGLLPEPTVPLERASGLSLDLLAKLAHFLESLLQARTTWMPSATRSLADWNAATAHLVETFIHPADAADTAHANTLKNALLPALAATAPPAVLLETSGYTRLLKEKLQRLNDSASRGEGGIRVGDLRQLAGVPARLVLITGLDNGTFPQSEDRPAWHPLARDRRDGDPSTRDADRHALLLAILSASERVVFSYCGGSDEDQKERPPSTALADVLNAVDAITLRANGQPAHTAILHRHPLSGSSPRAFLQHTNPNARGKNPSDHAAAFHIATRTRTTPLPGPWSVLLPEETDPHPSLDDLRILLREPARLFLHRLGVRPPREAEPFQGSDLVELNSLEKWSMDDALLRTRLENGDETALLTRLRLAGEVPRGALGNALLTNALREIPFTDRYQPGDRLGALCRITLPLPGSPSPRWIEGIPRPGWYQKPESPDRFYYSASKLKSASSSPAGTAWRHDLLFRLDALALAASAEVSRGPVIGRTHGIFKDRSQVLAPLTPEEASRHLTPLLTLYTLARRLPLPFWPASSQVLCEPHDAPRDSSQAPAEALEAAYQKWASGDFNASRPPDSQSPATRMAFRGMDDPFTWTPDVPADFLPAPSEPLAWRIALFFENWIASLPATISETASPKKNARHV